MNISRKKLVGAAFLILLIVLTLAAFFNGQDIGSIISAMEHADSADIFFAVLCVVAFLFCQGFIFRFLFSVLNQKTSLSKCIGYSFKGYFFCNVTPFAIGGPPAQILYMRKDNISLPVASMVVLIVATIYKIVLILLGIGLIVFGQSFLSQFETTVIVLIGVGMFMTCGFCFLLFMFMFHPRLAKKAIFKFFRWMERMHLMKHKYGREEEAEAGMSRYVQTADFFRSHPGTLAVIVILTVIQRTCLFSVTYFVYLSLGFHGVSFFFIVITQGTISLCVDMLPIPGGMGLSEALFVMMFGGVFTSGMLLPALALSRGINYYAQLCVCAAAVFVTQYAFKGRRKRMKSEIESKITSGDGKNKCQESETIRKSWMG